MASYVDGPVRQLSMNYIIQDSEASSDPTDPSVFCIFVVSCHISYHIYEAPANDLERTFEITLRYLSMALQCNLHTSRTMLVK